MATTRTLILWGWLGMLFLMLGATQPQEALCQWLGGQMERVSIPTRYLSQPLQGRVYLPPCYSQEQARAYPLLILLHGQNYSDDQWDTLGVDEVLDNLIPSKQLPPMVVFMPRETSWELPPESGFDEALMEDVLPWLESEYRLLPGPRYRAIGGISRGAAWAIRLGLIHWQTFGAIGGHSPPVFASDGLQVAKWLQAIPQDQWPRIYLDIGDADREEILFSAKEFEALLTTMGIPHIWRFNVGRHDPVYWQRHVHEYLQWYAQPWTEEQEP